MGAHQPEENVDLRALHHEAHLGLTDRVVTNVLDRIGEQDAKAVSLRTQLLFALGNLRTAVIMAVLLATVVGTSLLNSSGSEVSPIRTVVITPEMSPRLLELIASGQTLTATEVIVHFGGN